VIDRFEINRESKGLVFNHSFSLIENIWNEDGLYRLRASYADFEDTAYFHVFQSDTGLDRHIDSTIGLDKEQYSWTDTVEIYVVAPDYNRDNDRIERIGKGTEMAGSITIKTSKATLENYELIETDIDSGIFFGLVSLTGDQQHDVHDDKQKQNDASGFTGGKGYDQGEIASRGSDKIEVVFENENELIDASSKISWVLGTFERMPEQINEIHSITIRIHDEDMNVKQDYADSVYVLVWSNNDPDSKKIQLRETHERSGIFEGFVKLSTERSGLTTIKTKMPDTLYVKYFDNTVPMDISKSRSQEILLEIPIGDVVIENIQPKSELEIPSWVRNNAKWYADGLLGESDFTQGIGYLIENGIMQIPEMPERDESSTASGVPDWVKNNVKWWSDGQISDGDFISGIQHLVKHGIIRVN